MKPLSLRLKGFRGIRDGLGLDEVTLDLQALPADAQLVALAGANGKGKSTLMDNLHPYTVMPSRAGADGLGAFSYYDHLCASEAEKELVWEHDGRRYRTHMVFRTSGKRKAEAYLFEQPIECSDERASARAHEGDAPWTPVRTADGTVSDGKMETYERCVEAVLGSAQTFFTSVFSAQGKRQISALRNGEVKSLLADLLNLDDIRQTGQRASETARLLKAGLVTLRQERAAVANELARADTALAALGDVPARIALTQQAKTAAAQQLIQAQASVGHLNAQLEAQAAQQQRREALAADRAQAVQIETAAAQAQQDAADREAVRLAQIATRGTQRARQSSQRLRALESRKGQLATLLSMATRIAWACRRIGRAEHLAASRQERQAHAVQQMERLKDLQRQQQAHQERITSIEREAGQATLRVNDLARRLALTVEVPCAGTDLQGRCKLLSDAHEARTLKPSADATVEQLAAERRMVQNLLEQGAAAIKALASAPAQLHAAEWRLCRATARARELHDLAQQASALREAQSHLQALDAEREQIARDDAAAEAAEAAEREQARLAREMIETAGRERRERHATQLARIDTDLAALPAPFDQCKLAEAQAQVEAAKQQLHNSETAHAQALADGHAQDIERAQASRLTRCLAGLDERVSRCEKETSVWTLLAKALSHDGVIALCIDDAGPALASLANDLLLSCYGPRFTVGIHTLVETAKGEAREGFDIVVHDAESGQSKSMTLMSGGERVWINECLTRAVALYLAQESGRRYATLFSDEADGPLDPDRKRMFMAMKREVLRLGGYEREFFISQTPELTALADAVIDVESLQRTCMPVEVAGQPARSTVKVQRQPAS
jgi:exonuclease SbcC